MLTDDRSTGSPVHLRAGITHESGSAPQTGSMSSSTGGSPPSAAPPGFHPIRRSMTVDEGAQLRRRSTLSSPFGADSPFDHSDPRRHSSTFSDHSVNDTRRNLHDDILNPSGASLESHEGSNWSSVPLAFALLPAVGGLFFKNGSSIITDIMLLGLAAVFLHWSVTQPWIWYHSAQRIRVREETLHDLVGEDESDDEASQAPQSPVLSRSSVILDDVPEEINGELNGSGDVAPPKNADHHAEPVHPHITRSRQDALKELYRHELMALVTCFLWPMIGAYMLHAIRAQLSRPSEGLVSNYNLTIFLLAAEIHPLSHLIKLVRARTLQLQRVVHANPYTGPAAAAAGPAALSQLEALSRRLDELEARPATDLGPADKPDHPASDSGAAAGKQARQAQEAAVARDVRNAMQPELDALNRAVRRYEKKATVLAFQTEARLGAMDARLGDAVALAAAAAKMSTSQRSLLAWLADRLLWGLMLPFRAAWELAALPFTTLSKVLGLGRGSGGRAARERERERKGYHDKSGSGGGGSRDRRGARPGQGPTRMNSADRVPSRLSKR